jgi:uncharacterized membrane protein
VSARTTIAAPVTSVWAVAADPSLALAWMSGVTRWEVTGEQSTGVGARHRMLFRIGAAEIGGLIEIVEWDAPFDLAWTSVTGIDQRGRLRLRRVRGDTARAEFRLAYGVPGAGIAGWIAERIAAPVVSAHLARSLRLLTRQVEHEQARERAAARRADRPAR